MANGNQAICLASSQQIPRRVSFTNEHKDSKHDTSAGGFAHNNLGPILAMVLQKFQIEDIKAAFTAPRSCLDLTCQVGKIKVAKSVAPSLMAALAVRFFGDTSRTLYHHQQSRQ